MKLELVSALLNACAALTGVTAAFFWFKASRKVSFDEALSMITKPGDLMDVYWKLRKVDADAQISARWNRIASLWTAVSVLLAGAASMISALAAQGSHSILYEPLGSVTFTTHNSSAMLLFFGGIDANALPTNMDEDLYQR